MLLGIMVVWAVIGIFYAIDCLDVWMKNKGE